MFTAEAAEDAEVWTELAESTNSFCKILFFLSPKGFVIFVSFAVK